MNASEPSPFWRPPESSYLYLHPEPAASWERPPSGPSADWEPPAQPPTRLMLWLGSPIGVRLFEMAGGTAVAGSVAVGVFFSAVAEAGHPIIATTPALLLLLRWVVPGIDIAAASMLLIARRDRTGRSRGQRRARQVALKLELAAKRQARRARRAERCSVDIPAAGQAAHRGTPVSAVLLRPLARRRYGLADLPSRAARGVMTAIVESAPLIAFGTGWIVSDAYRDVSASHVSQAAQLFGSAIIGLHLLAWFGLTRRQVTRNRARAAIGLS